MSSITSAVPPIAPHGTPPPSALARQTMSGTTPKRSMAPPGRDREPGLHLVEREQRAVGVQQVGERRRGSPGGGGMTPMFIITGSMIIPAISPGWSSRTRRTASRSPNGTTWVSAAIAGGDGAVLGHRARPVGGPGVVGVRVDRDLHGVVVTVVAALDLDDPLATGGGAHQVDGGHRRLGAGVGEAPQRQPEAAGQLGGDGDDVGHRLGEVGAGGDALG